MFREASSVGIGRSMVPLLALCLPLLSVTVPGTVEANALQFDGVDDYGDIGPWPGVSSQLMTHPVTVECWVQSSNTADDLTLFGAVNTTDSMFFRITLNRDGMRVQQPGESSCCNATPPVPSSGAEPRPARTPGSRTANGTIWPSSSIPRSGIWRSTWTVQVSMSASWMLPPPRT